MTSNPSLEHSLRARRSVLKMLETNRAVKELRWKDVLAKADDWEKPVIVEQNDRWRAKNDYEISVVNSQIFQLEQQIAQRDEDARKQTEARAWLEPVKAKALESWLASGGTAAGFEASWPEMERQVLMQETLEILAVQSNTQPRESLAVQPKRKRKTNERKKHQ